MIDLVERYGSWALVAGASEGIGAAFSRALAAAGFDLVLIARRAEPLDALAAELRAQHGRTVETLALDLAAPDLEARLREQAGAREIGLVVYNAALSIVAPFLDTPLADKQRILDVNARGPLIAAHVFGEAMAARGRGAIVLVSSLTAFWGSAWVTSYGATKAFNLALGEGLAQELGERGVDVVVTCAGATRTPGFVRLVEGRRGPRAMSPDAVARATLARLPRRGAFVPGLFNRFAQFVMARLLPRRTAVGLMARETRALLRAPSDTGRDSRTRGPS
jgi:short-subunit dehydrogenase